MDQRTPTRTKRTFIPHEGTFASLYSRIIDQKVRCWLDMGPQHQCIRRINYFGVHGEPAISLTIRIADDKIGRFVNAPDDPVTWYEEEQQ